MTPAAYPCSIVWRMTTTSAARAPRTRRRPSAPPPYLSPAERAERGMSARASVPRESHALFDPPSDRPDPIGLLEQQAESRVPELVPVRYGRMMASPFAYYRGAAMPMASDLAATPVSGLRVQACGDAHLANFGAFASPERNLIFSLNDFDETLPGPWEWDVKRLAASLEVAARGNGFSRAERRAIVRSAVASYRHAMRGFAPLSNLDVWYAHMDLADEEARLKSRMTARQRKRFGEGLAKARTRDSVQAFSKLARIEDGAARIIADPPLIVPYPDLLPGKADRANLQEAVHHLIGAYGRTLESSRRDLLAQYRVSDIARKVVGVGSVGTRCWIVLMRGRDAADPLFLQVKEAEKSVLSGFAGASRFNCDGERVVVGQRLMRAVSDIFLGWERIDGMDGKRRDFYVRQLRDWKFSMDIDRMIPSGLRMYGERCGWTLARAHARSGDRIAIASYLGRSDGFERAITEFSEAYADQNERDHDALVRAVRMGRITAIQDL